MTAFVLALTASLCWGLSDFLGGLKTRTVPLPVVLAVSQSAGLLGLAVPVLVTGRFLPEGDRLGLAVGAGLASLSTLAFLYSALARGSMVVATPIAASGVMLPVLIGIAGGDRLGPAPAAGIVLAVLGCVAASWEPTPLGHGRRLVAGALLAVGAAVSIGLFFTLLDAASTEDPYAATFTMRLTSCLLVLAFLAGQAVRRSARARAGSGSAPGTATATRPATAAATAGGRRVAGRRQRLPRLSGTVLLTLAGIGIADALAEISFAVSATDGLLSVTSVLASLYPVVTVALAMVILRERAHWLQFCGAATALLGVVLLAQA